MIQKRRLIRAALLVLALCCIYAVQQGWSWYDYNVRKNDIEREFDVIDFFLHTIDAQKQLHKQEGRYGTLKELYKANLIPGRYAHGMAGRHQLIDHVHPERAAHHFKILILPPREGMSYFYITEERKLLRSKTGPASKRFREGG
jgi:hypothetical protein